MPPTASQLLAPLLLAGCAWSIPLATLRAQPGRGVDAVSPAVDSARAALNRGDVERAIGWYDRALAADSLDRVALRESADAISSRGDWRRALPRLTRLARLGVSDPALNHSLGQYLVWAGRNDSGTVFLRRAVAQAPDSLAWRLTLGQALTWSPASRAEGVRVLRDLEAVDPRNMPVRQALAAALSWDPTSRGEAIERFRAMLTDEPRSTSIRNDYADVLSWIVDSRGEAMLLYEAVQRDDPQNVRAALGRLNILVWTNRTAAALALTDSLLTNAPPNAEVQRARGRLLLQAGRVDDALAALRPLVDSLPEDIALLEPYGYALLAKGDFGAARRVARRIPEGTAPGAPDWIRRGAAPALGIDGLYTNTSLGLETFRLTAAASTPLTPNQRVVVSGGPVRYNAPGGGFDGSAVTLGLTGRLGSVRDTRAEVGLEQFEGAPGTWNARAEGTRPLPGGGALRLVARRTPIEDSRRAARGESVDGRFIGQVRANALDVNLTLPEIGRGLGLQFVSTLAAYTGRGLRTNVRREGTLALTKPLRVGTQRLETGVGVMGMSFLFDANRIDTPLNEQGRYWSPTSFANAIVTLGMSLPVTGRLVVRVDGTGGRQLAGRIPGASAFNFAGGGTVRWTGYRGWDVASGFLYLDNLGGFQLRQWNLSLRRAW